MVISMADADPQRRSFTVKGRATRDRIVACATELVVRNGFAALSIDHVRKAASVSGSQMTHYFADKDSLVQAIVARQTQALMDFHRQAELRGLDTFEDLERWAEFTLEMGNRRRPSSGLAPWAGLAGDVTVVDDETRRLLAEGLQQCLDLLADGLRRMKDRGQLIAEANPEQLAYVLLSAHQGVDVRTLAGSRGWPDGEALEFALTYVRQFAADAARPRQGKADRDVPRPRRTKRRS
jgi:AcrR family transcriptional regulator